MRLKCGKESHKRHQYKEIISFNYKDKFPTHTDTSVVDSLTDLTQLCDTSLIST